MAPMSICSYIGLMTVAASMCSVSALAQSQNSTKPVTAMESRDGSHDFDFELGAWKTYLRVLTHAPDGSAKWTEYHGTTVVHSIWEGRANLVELEVDGASGHVEAISLRLYNPSSHQWS